MEPTRTSSAALNALQAGESAQANSFFASGELDETCAETLLHLVDGTVVQIPTALLLREASLVAQPGQAQLPAQQDAMTIPVIEEQLTVAKRTVVTGTVRLQRDVTEHPHVVDEPLLVQSYEAKRVQMETPIGSVPFIRQEGDVTIYPVTEERLVLAKQLFLVEEVHVTKRLTERREQQTILLKREDIKVIRSAGDKVDESSASVQPETSV